MISEHLPPCWLAEPPGHAYWPVSRIDAHQNMGVFMGSWKVQVRIPRDGDWDGRRVSVGVQGMPLCLPSCCLTGGAPGPAE